MLGRIFGMLLGLALGGVAYAILNPGGLEGRIPPIPLGAFESLRFYVAMAAAGLGAIIFIAALLPKGPGGPSGGGGKTRRKGGPPVTIDFNDPAPMTAHDHGSTHAHHAAEVVAEAAEAPAVAEVAPEPEVHSGAPPGAQGAFAEARRELHEHTRAERWSQAADNVRRLSSLAGDEHERRLAAQDAGDFARAQGLTDQAAEAYDEALTYARQIGEPAALADAREDRGHRMRAMDLYRQSLAISGTLAAADPVASAEDLAVTRRRLAEL
ncbi:MAG: hypothetical protein Q7U11_02285, partial [Phenylobacterium sp.]|nr:hypothetical protein [Phenylobacterium sp.]